MRDNYNLTLLAFDGTHATTAIMMVTLNSGASSTFDCDPDKSIEVKVAENVKKNTEVHHEESRPPTTGARYLLISSEVLPFAVDQDTGAITTKAALDAETRKKVSFLSLYFLPL